MDPKGIGFDVRRKRQRGGWYSFDKEHDHSPLTPRILHDIRPFRIHRGID